MSARLRVYAQGGKAGLSFEIFRILSAVIVLGRRNIGGGGQETAANWCVVLRFTVAIELTVALPPPSDVARQNSFLALIRRRPLVPASALPIRCVS